MCTLFVARVAQISNLRLALVSRRSHKNLDRGRHYVRELLVEHVHSPCLPFRELTVPWLLNGATIERIACVTQSTELDGDAENGLRQRFRLQQVRQAFKGWRDLSSIYEERGISTTFVGWLLCDFNRCPKLRKFVEKNTNNGEWTVSSTGQRSASGEKQNISTHLLLWETLRGRLVSSKKSLNAVQNK